MEPGETIEDAVRRETFEETGIKIGNGSYLMSQPWPFPSSLMIGVVGQAQTTQISINEEELDDARWFSASEIRQMGAGTHLDDFTLPSYDVNPPTDVGAAFKRLSFFLCATGHRHQIKRLLPVICRSDGRILSDSVGES